VLLTRFLRKQREPKRKIKGRQKNGNSEKSNESQTNKGEGGGVRWRRKSSGDLAGEVVGENELWLRGSRGGACSHR